MHLKSELLASISENAFEHPSEVQRECIPQGIQGMDILCQAKSGMGKTAVFIMIILQRMHDPKPFSALVLCNTRELAQQIKREFDRFSKNLKISTECVQGGVPLRTSQEAVAKNPHVLVGTPGRMLKLLNEKKFTSENVEQFVLDECDRLIEEVGVRADIQNIFVRTPFNKQTMMFSATMSKEAKDTCRKFLRNKIEVIIDNDSNLTLHGLQQYQLHIGENQKNRKVQELIKELHYSQLVVFMKSVTRAAELERVLLSHKIDCVAIHAGMPQDQRLERYQLFKENKRSLLIATDIFSRGIDIGKVNVVINYDIPDSSDQQLHRVGRAGRFGTKGLTVTFVNPESKSDLDTLETIQKRFEVKISPLPQTIDKTSYM